jgi:TM2 domain-containing membrane protein YozV
MLLSLAFPGAGQVYNKKLWYIRAPIATGAVTGGVIFYIYSRQNYLVYRNAVRDRNNGIETEFDSNPNATTAALRTVRDEFRKQMEQALFGTIIVHLLNGVEAFATAHLLNFDVSDDLSFKIEPNFQNTYQGNAMMGLGISISPKYSQPQPVNFSLY